MHTNLDKIRDKIQTFAPDQNYDPRDLIELASITLQLLEELERTNLKLTRVSSALGNALSCLQNGIEPD